MSLPRRSFKQNATHLARQPCVKLQVSRKKKLAINQRVSVKYQRCFTLLPLFNRSPAKISGLVLCDVFQVLLIVEILCVAAS